MSFSLTSHKLCKVSLKYSIFPLEILEFCFHIKFGNRCWGLDHILISAGDEAIVRFCSSTEGKQLEYKFDHKICVLMCK